MNQLYKKNELGFALAWIGAYCLLQSLANPLSEATGIGYSVHAALSLAMTAALLGWIRKNRLQARYGLCRAVMPARAFLWYIPLLLLSSSNLWLGVAMSFSPAVMACYIVHMFCVGVIEEILFRGFLFRAIARDNLRSAVVISSVTFGLGHLLNLFNGSGMTLISNLFQVFGAILFGFLFVFLFMHSGSLIPCIAAHSTIDVLSAFANRVAFTPQKRLIVSLIECAIAVVYLLWLRRTVPERKA